MAIDLLFRRCLLLLLFLILSFLIGNGLLWAPDSRASESSAHKEGPSCPQALDAIQDPGLSASASQTPESWWPDLSSTEGRMILLRRLMGPFLPFRSSMGKLHDKWNPWAVLEPALGILKSLPEGENQIRRATEISSSVPWIQTTIPGRNGRPPKTLSLEAVPPLVGLFRDYFGSNHHGFTSLPYYALLKGAQVFFIRSQVGEWGDAQHSPRFYPDPDGYIFVVQAKVIAPDGSQKIVPHILEIDAPDLVLDPGEVETLLLLVGHFYQSPELGISDDFVHQAQYSDKEWNGQPQSNTGIQRALKDIMASSSKVGTGFPELDSLVVSADWSTLEEFPIIKPLETSPKAWEIPWTILRTYRPNPLGPSYRSWLYTLKNNRDGGIGEAPPILQTTRRVTLGPLTPISDWTDAERVCVATHLLHNEEGHSGIVDQQHGIEILEALHPTTESSKSWAKNFHSSKGKWLRFLTEGPKSYENLLDWLKSLTPFTDEYTAKIGALILERILTRIQERPQQDSQSTEESLRMIKHILSLPGMDVNGRMFQSLLHKAAAVPDFRFLQVLLEKNGLNPWILNEDHSHNENPRGPSITHIAANNLDLRVLMLLLEDQRLTSDALNGKNSSGTTPLLTLVFRSDFDSDLGHEVLVSILRHKLFDPRTLTQENGNGSSPLGVLASREKFDYFQYIMRLLKQMGHSPFLGLGKNQTSKEKIPFVFSMLYAAARNADERVLDYVLHEFPASLDANPKDWVEAVGWTEKGRTIFHAAAANPNLGVINLLLSYLNEHPEINPNILLMKTLAFGTSSIHSAAENTNPEVLKNILNDLRSKKLLDLALNENLNEERKAPLHVAKPRNLILLLSYPELAARTINGRSIGDRENILHLAVRSGDPSLMRTLLQDPRLKPELVYERNIYGLTPVVLALSIKNQRELIQELEDFEKSLDSQKTK